MCFSLHSRYIKLTKGQGFFDNVHSIKHLAFLNDAIFVGDNFVDIVEEADDVYQFVSLIHIFSRYMDLYLARLQSEILIPICPATHLILASTSGFGRIVRVNDLYLFLDWFSVKNGELVDRSAV